MTSGNQEILETTSAEGASWHYQQDEVVVSGGESKWVRRVKTVVGLILAVIFLMLALAVMLGLLLNYGIFSVPEKYVDVAIILEIENRVGTMLQMMGLK